MYKFLTPPVELPAKVFYFFRIVGKVGLEPTTQGSKKQNRNTLCF